MRYAKSDFSTMLAILAFLLGGPFCLADAPRLTLPDEITLLSGSPLHIPLDGSDADGGPIAYSATSDSALVSTSLPEGNRSLRITVADHGDMVFELFENRVPRVTDRIISLADDGFYDGLFVHRVIDEFVIQAGDPTGTGAGGSDLGPFDDQYHVDLQHNREGVLSMAKAGDDTNNSQFFVTDFGPPSRHLDFNHAIFGQLIEGFDVLQSISAVPTDGSRPITDVVMESVEVFLDDENAVLMLKAPEGTSGEANITVTATDPDGNESVQTFQVTVEPDTANGAPFLEDIDDLQTVKNQSVSLQLRAMDVEGDPVAFRAEMDAGVPFEFQLDEATGLVEITPPLDYVGELMLLVGVSAVDGSDTLNRLDTQLVTIDVVVPEPVGNGLLIPFLLVLLAGCRRSLNPQP